ncbi:MAG: hypothetical protein ACKVS9_04245 [Phycisphaerae bacterium]
MRNGKSDGILGGLQTSLRQCRRWRWQRDERVTQLVRCKPEQWYLIRADANGDPTPAVLTVEFADDRRVAATREVTLQRMRPAAHDEPLLGWVQSPVGSRWLRLRVGNGHAATVREATLIAVAERDPKSHATANVPPWSTYEPPFPILRVVLPKSMEALADTLRGVRVEVVRPPKSLRELARYAIGAACIVDPAWIESLKLSMADLERIIPASWMIVDLPTQATLLKRGKLADTEIKTYRSRNEIMSARVEFADVPTRGFALMDVLPYGVCEDDGHYSVRVLRATRSWKKYADETGFALMLSSQTPWEARCNDVIGAMRALGQGELIACDVPWLAAGALGRPLAPRLAAHLARMLVGLPCETWAQYWTRGDDLTLLLRDIADLARRYEPLVPVRWQTSKGVTPLGITLAAGENAIRRHVMFRTGRIDAGSLHDGLPAEPMMIFMRRLSREVRERTAWARENLRDVTVTWQFETTSGQKYCVAYDSAAELAARRFEATEAYVIRGGGAPDADIAIAADEGILGDGSLDFQPELSRRLIAILREGGRS